VIAKNMRDGSRDSRADIDCDAAPWKSDLPARKRNAKCVRGTTVKSHDPNRMRVQATWQWLLKQSRRAHAETALESRRFRDWRVFATVLKAGNRDLVCSANGNAWPVESVGLFFEPPFITRNQNRTRTFVSMLLISVTSGRSEPASAAFYAARQPVRGRASSSYA
jgi:hypothetical protein